jgi:hypothetical protein
MTLALAPSFAAPLEPDYKAALTFFATLYPVGRGEIIHFRGVPEPKDSRPPHNSHYALDENFEENVRGYLDWCRVDGRAAFFLPGTVQGAGTGKKDVLSLPAVLVDFDKGKPDENLAAVEALLGPATIVVESGGRTESGLKLHAYWALREPAKGDADIGLACGAREALAIRFGGDPAFKQAAQVIRVPGSLHFKGQPTLVRLRTVRPEARYELTALASAAGATAPKATNSDNPFDFSGDVAPRNDVERVLTAPVHEGGVDDITRFEAAGKAIGHFIRMVREGRMTPDEAWQAACEWNAATLVPPWSEERLRGDFERLVRNDVEVRGPFIPVQPVAQETVPEGFAVQAWRADRFAGDAPERVWAVEGLIPAGTAGVFAAVGDAGKSMMALKLALQIATTPPPTPAMLDVSSPRFFGQAVTARGAAVVLTAEDDADEVHRRLNGLDPTHARKDRPLYVVPMLATGGARSILVDGPAGPVQTDFWRELRQQLLAVPDLRLVVLDPLSSFVSADINKDNVAGAALMTMLGELATTSGAAVMLVHHFAKAMVPTDLSDARSAIRGAGALVDNGRWALAMWEADQDKAYAALKALGQPERSKQSGLVYLGGLAKGNAPGAKTLRMLVRAAGTGVLEDQTDNIIAAAPRHDEVDDAVYKALRSHKENKPRFVFPLGKSSFDRYLVPVLKVARVDISMRSLEACLGRLVERGLLVESEQPGKYEPSLE